MSSPSMNRGPERTGLRVQYSAEPARRVLNDREFRRMLALERRRAERTRSPFVLMQAEHGDQKDQIGDSSTLRKIAEVLLKDSRATDIVGWYKEGAALGVLFTGLAAGDRIATLDTISQRVKATLERDLALDDRKTVRLEFYFFPDDWGPSSSNDPGDPALRVDAIPNSSRTRLLLSIKRAIDIVFSAIALLILSPVFLWIALAIKATSKGPVFFRQRRIGRCGKQFVSLKFRTMYQNSDKELQRKFVAASINDNARLQSPRDDFSPYKLREDLRVTRLGRFLRRMRLDELPQLLNVLKGEMSLVGPRPAIPYELEAYQTWHRRRVLASRPGITGIWQVNGRSRVRFDEMVRMDLRYWMVWSPWLDLKILFLTPFAIIRGTGAL